MASTENKIMQKRLASAYLSSIFSIAMVLLLVGAASLLLVNAGNVSTYFKENMKISVVFKHEASERDCVAYQKKLDAKPYIKSTEYVSKEQGTKEMIDLLGEDFLTVFDTAPIPISLNVSVKADYVTPEKIDSVMADMGTSKIVDEVVGQKSLIEALNSNLHKISMFLAVFIVLLMFISFVLISNTVRLNLYSKRFTIHTMRLVGATKAFIRRPFMVEGLFQGVIAALLSIIIMLGALIYVKSEFALLFTVFQLKQLLIVMGIMIASGALLCLFTTFIVTNRMVDLKKEELYF